MRIKSIFLFLTTILLASCAVPTPQPTVTPLPTSTTPPTFTATPTRRPPTASEPSWFQNDDGLFVFNFDKNEWDKVENPADGSGIYESGDKQFILMDNQLLWVESVRNVDGETQVVTEDGQKLVWAGGEWEVASQMPPGAEALLATEGMAWDETDKLVYDSNTGLVWGVVDAQGEWRDYPDGNVAIPAGDGSEAPPLLVPIYRTFTDAMWAVTDELPWGELAYSYREKQVKAREQLHYTYIEPIRGVLDVPVHIHATGSPEPTAMASIYQVTLPGGIVGTQLIWASRTTDYYFKDVMIFADPETIVVELERIDECVRANGGADNLAELCASETIFVPAPGEVKEE